MSEIEEESDFFLFFVFSRGAHKQPGRAMRKAEDEGWEKRRGMPQ